jgi:hypothetical protein
MHLSRRFFVTPSQPSQIGVAMQQEVFPEQAAVAES